MLQSSSSNSSTVKFPCCTIFERIVLVLSFVEVVKGDAGEEDRERGCGLSRRSSEAAVDDAAGEELRERGESSRSRDEKGL